MAKNEGASVFRFWEQTQGYTNLDLRFASASAICADIRVATEGLSGGKHGEITVAKNHESFSVSCPTGDSTSALIQFYSELHKMSRVSILSLGKKNLRVYKFPNPPASRIPLRDMNGYMHVENNSHKRTTEPDFVEIQGILLVIKGKLSHVQ